MMCCGRRPHLSPTPSSGSGPRYHAGPCSASIWQVPPIWTRSACPRAVQQPVDHFPLPFVEFHLLVALPKAGLLEHRRKDRFGLIEGAAETVEEPFEPGRRPPHPDPPALVPRYRGRGGAQSTTAPWSRSSVSPSISLDFRTSSVSVFKAASARNWKLRPSMRPMRRPAGAAHRRGARKYAPGPSESPATRCAREMNVSALFLRIVCVEFSAYSPQRQAYSPHNMGRLRPLFSPHAHRIWWMELNN